MTRDSAWMDASAASAALGVTRATLYAYVSRGYVRSESLPGPRRRRRYSRDDIERVRRRTESRRDPEQAAAHALQWGVPILESSITLIADGRLYYRGHDAVVLARSRSVAEVAALVWTGRFEAASTLAAAQLRPSAPGSRDRHLPFIARAQSMLATAAARDSLAFDLRPAGVALTGWRVLHLLAAIAAGARAADPAIDRTLARAWDVKGGGIDVLRAALILSADHELNVSAFTARCVASAGANPYAVVLAGLSAIEGTRHGGVSRRVEALLDAMRRASSVRKTLADRLRRGEAIDGFGHPLYRDGDPRATALLELLRQRYPRSAELVYVLEAAEAAESVMRERPTIDFALAAVARVLRLPPGSPLTIFAIGRTIGWIGHAIEQYTAGSIIRPRARYVGQQPPQP
jgi:citrate synthase